MTNVTHDSVLSNEEVELELEQRSFVRSFLKIIFIIITIILYPYVWIGKEFLRLFKFLGGGKENKDQPLNYQEITFVESIPIFLMLTGIAVASILGIVAWIGFSQKIKDFWSNLTDPFSGLAGLIIGFLEFLRDVIFGIVDIIFNVLGAIIDTVGGIIQGDSVLLLLIAVVIIFILIAIFLAFSELSIHKRILRKLGFVGLGLSELPRAVYQTLDNFWIKVLRKVGSLVSGGRNITERSRKFYQRITWLVFLFALWTFLWGILLLIGEILEGTDFTSDDTILINTILYMIFVLLISGFLAGVILMFTLVTLLNKVSGEKYTPDEKILTKARHQSVLDFLIPKTNKYSAIPLSTISNVVHIPVNEISNHWSDALLTDFKIYSTHVVNQKLYNKRIAKVDEWEEEGLENEDINLLIRAVDYLAYIQRSLRNVPEINDDLEERREILFEDIADLRGQTLENNSSSEEEA